MRNVIELVNLEDNDVDSVGQCQRVQVEPDRWVAVQGQRVGHIIEVGPLAQLFRAESREHVGLLVIVDSETDHPSVPEVAPTPKRENV